MPRILATRSIKNPILRPNPDLQWQEKAVFNPSIIQDKDKFTMVYRAISADQEYAKKVINLNSIGVCSGPHYDDFNSQEQKILISPSTNFDRFGCEDPRITKIDDDYFIFYTAISDHPPGKKSIKVAVAITKDLETIEAKYLVTPFNAKAFVLFPEKINGQYVGLVTVNTDDPPARIAIAKFEYKEQIWDASFWRQWYANLNDHILNVARYNNDLVEVGAVPVMTEEGWVLIYAHIQNYFEPEKRIFGIEALLLDSKNPQNIIGRTSDPILTPQESYEMDGMIGNVIFPSSCIMEGEDFKIYYGAADTVCAVASIKKSILLGTLLRSEDKEIIKFHKYPHNPILVPKEKSQWQAQAVFNSAAIHLNDQFYMLYRAMSWDHTSTIGGAVSDDGFNFRPLSLNPIYVPRMDFENKIRPFAFSGCEDPRITKFGDKIYMFYTAYNGDAPPRVALSWIEEQDFIDRNWLWSKPITISDPNTDNKNACLFPEKIAGKYVVLHRSAGKDIAVDFVDELTDFSTKKIWLEKEAAYSPRENWWDSAKIGIAGPPMKTEKGWLLIYHGVSAFDKNYRLGYMILDLEDPLNVLYRSKYPILEPEFDYEHIGIVNHVVFSCGAAIHQNTVYLYYGGADRVMAVATLELDKLLNVI